MAPRVESSGSLGVWAVYWVLAFVVIAFLKILEMAASCNVFILCTFTVHTSDTICDEITAISTGSCVIFCNGIVTTFDEYTVRNVSIGNGIACDEFTALAAGNGVILFNSNVTTFVELTIFIGIGNGTSRDELTIFSTDTGVTIFVDGVATSEGEFKVCAIGIDTTSDESGDIIVTVLLGDGTNYDEFDFLWDVPFRVPRGIVYVCWRLG